MIRFFHYNQHQPLQSVNYIIKINVKITTKVTVHENILHIMSLKFSILCLSTSISFWTASLFKIFNCSLSFVFLSINKLRSSKGLFITLVASSMVGGTSTHSKYPQYLPASYQNKYYKVKTKVNGEYNLTKRGERTKIINIERTKLTP